MTREEMLRQVLGRLDSFSKLHNALSTEAEWVALGLGCSITKAATLIDEARAIPPVKPVGQSCYRCHRPSKGRTRWYPFDKEDVDLCGIHLREAKGRQEWETKSEAKFKESDQKQADARELATALTNAGFDVYISHQNGPYYTGYVIVKGLLPKKEKGL